MTKETAVCIVGVIFLAFLMVVYGWLLIIRRRYHNKGDTMTPIPQPLTKQSELSNNGVRASGAMYRQGETHDRLKTNYHRVHN
jgi:hypothetical protein